MPPESPAIDHICVRFATFRDQPAPQRARIAAELASIPGDERVLLDTCHRVELVTVHRDGMPIPTEGVVRGSDAVRRVFEVVAGFDSAVVAEEQLLGQVRTTYEAALAAGSTGPVLNELFRRALRFGRRVRTHARPGSDRSLADRGATWLAERLSESARVTVVGTGEMGRLVAGRLASAGHPLTIVSGSGERAGRLVEALPRGAHRVAVGALGQAALGDAEAIVVAIRPREPVVTAELLGFDRPWILDLSTPSAVEPPLAESLGERLLSVDVLGTLPGAMPILAEAAERRLRAELETEVERFATWLEGRHGADAVTVLHGEADAVRRRHLERLRRRTLLDADQLAAVDAAAAAMLGELLHGPTVEIRRGGADAQLVRRLFGIEA